MIRHQSVSVGPKHSSVQVGARQGCLGAFFEELAPGHKTCFPSFDGCIATKICKFALKQLLMSLQGMRPRDRQVRDVLGVQAFDVPAGSAVRPMVFPRSPSLDANDLAVMKLQGAAVSRPRRVWWPPGVPGQ